MPRAAWSTSGYAGRAAVPGAAAAALAGRAAVTGSLPAGLFPRDLGYDPAAGYVLVPDYLSENVEFLRAPPAP